MKCPKCNHEQTCPCPTCQKRAPTEKPWVWTTGDVISCGGCGLTKHCDWWLDEEYRQYEEEKDND